MASLYYRGDTILLYVKFHDSEGKPVLDVIEPKVSVIHEKNSQIIYDVEDVELNKLSNSEYFYYLRVSSDADYGFREVIYSGKTNETVDGEEVERVSRIVESFHVIASSSIGENVIRINGYVHQLRTGYPLISTSVVIKDNLEQEILSETFTKDDGSWEAYTYPGEYKISFNKFGFKSQDFTVQLGNEKTELRFDNVALESVNDINKGNGIYVVSDRYLNKNGIPLNGLKVKVNSIFNIADEPIATDITGDDGEWQVFLDPGMYFMKVEGNSMNNDYSYIFRLKVSDDGTSQFENISNNIAVPVDEQIAGRGNGSNTVSDVITDRNGNPIIDVQVTVFVSTDMNTIIAEDYTDVTGKWEVFLDPGSYVFEYYHPEFNVIQENRTI